MRQPLGLNWRFGWYFSVPTGTLYLYGFAACAMRRFIWGIVCVGLLSLLLAGSDPRSATAGARNPCLEEGNLTQNCGFDTFVDNWQGDKRYQIPEGWWYFILAGELEYRPSDDTYWGAPSLWMLSDGVPYTAGIYQQVQVTPGVVYLTDIGWAAPSQEDFERKLGLDPTGGTDPLAPTVIWSRSEWEKTRWPDLTVSARATGPTMTVFVWVHHPRAYGLDWIFLDAVGLWPDPSQPAATATPVPSATPTQRPPTRTPSPVPLTHTPTPTATATATVTETPTAAPSLTATLTPTVTPTPTWTATPRPPTATPFPTRTPLPTLVPVAQLVSDAQRRDLSGVEGASSDSGKASTWVIIGIAAIAVVVSTGTGGWWLLRRRNSESKE
jgi:hypothetical protein